MFSTDLIVEQSDGGGSLGPVLLSSLGILLPCPDLSSFPHMLVVNFSPMSLCLQVTLRNHDNQIWGVTSKQVARLGGYGHCEMWNCSNPKWWPVPGYNLGSRWWRRNRHKLPTVDKCLKLT